MLLALVLVSLKISMSAQEVEGDSLFVQIRYPNGQVSSEGIMKNNKPDGFWRTYYVTGVIKSEGKRTNFLLDSIWNFYNQAGELTQQISYQLGEKSGFSNSYSFSNPQNPGQATLVSKELYVRGKKEGNSFYYHPTGELRLIVFYKDGKKQGLSREFTRDSTLITVLKYKDNYVVDRERVNRVDPEGNKQGTHREYYENGQVKKEEQYLDDQLHGYYREFDGQGDLVLAIRYERGQIMEEIDEDEEYGEEEEDSEEEQEEDQDESDRHDRGPEQPRGEAAPLRLVPGDLDPPESLRPARDLDLGPQARSLIHRGRGRDSHRDAGVQNLSDAGRQLS